MESVARAAGDVREGAGWASLDWLRLNRHRALKLGAAALLGASLLAASLSGIGVVATSNAVISAQLVSLRAPIDGTLSGDIVGVGMAVSRGDVLARLQNPRADDQRLSDLGAQFTRLHAEGLALAGEYDRLLHLRTVFTERGRVHNDAATQRLTGLQAEGERDLSARLTQRDRLQQLLGRRAQLETAGYAARDDVDQIRANLRAASQQVDGARSHLDSLRAEADAARTGVFSAPGANDVPYSVQRADEVDLHLSSLAREIAFLGGMQTETQERLAAETRRHGLAADALLTAPVDGIVWRVDAAAGERLSTGDSAVALVDCRTPQLLAAIPQERAAEIEIGGMAQFRIYGRDEEMTGRILSVSGDLTGAAASHLAAAPLTERGLTAIVRVAAPPSPNQPGGCLVGTSARVTLPTADAGPLSRLMRALFRPWL